MTKKLIWRLKEQPSTESLRELVKDKILTNEEAREILFTSQEETERDVKSYQEEIKFLRDLIEKLSDRNKIVEVVKEYHYTQPWYQPYHYWTTGVVYCGNTTTGTANAISGTLTSGLTSGSGYTQTGAGMDSQNCSFSSIQTF